MNKFFPLALLVLLLVTHLPFLTADPDRITDIHTRGAWTDEGLYASQARNLVTGGELNLRENSTFIRGPLFPLLQLPVFYAAGTHRLPIRVLVLLTTFLVPLLFIRLKGFETLSFFMILLVYSQFHVFHFSHYAMAEMLAVSMTVLALFFLVKSQTEKALLSHRVWYILLACLSVFIAYSLKIQFVYLVALLPFSLFVIAITDHKERETGFHIFGLSMIFSVLLLGIYALWYAVNKDFYNYIMTAEMSGRFPDQARDFVNIARWNFDYFLWVRELKVLWVMIPISVLIVFWEKLSRKIGRPSRAAWIFSLCWLLLELHKLPMSYIPNRYLLPLFTAGSLLIAYALSLMFQRSQVFALISLLLGFAIAGHNLPFHLKAYKERTYELRDMNSYLAQQQYDGRYILGSWAASVSWGTDAKTLPVWYNYFNDIDPLTRFKPACIIAERDESDSDKAFLQRGVQLEAVSDSSRSFHLWRYEVVVYWMKNWKGRSLPFSD